MNAKTNYLNKIDIQNKIDELTYQYESEYTQFVEAVPTLERDNPDQTIFTKAMDLLYYINSNYNISLN